jgi:acyl-CoA thioesterase YciA
MKKDIGIHDNLFGGNMLAWIDEAGAAFASQKIDTPRVVTVKMSEVIFKEPITVGQLIKIYGEVVKIGNTSITLKLDARRHKPNSGKQKSACEVELVFVRIDEDGEPTPISQKIKDKYGNKL